MQQILRATDYTNWKDVYVACSGLFSFERAFAKVHPGARYHGNDVSLMSRAIAAYAMDEEVDFTFKGRVAHFEERLNGASYRDRVAAMLLVLYLGRVFRTENKYNEAHWRYYEENFDHYVAKLGQQADHLAAELSLTSYHNGDFREHLAEGMEKGAALIISAPFIQGWYERWFRFINENLEWDEPSYDMWNPEKFPDLISELDASGCDYVAVYKDELPDQNLIAYHRMGMKPPFFVYANKKRVGSVVDESLSGSGMPFRFNPTDIGKITKDSKVEVFVCKAGHADYIKSLYLQENIPWTSGPVNFLVYIDDMLAGILTFSPSKFAVGDFAKSEILYLLSDTATTRFGRVSKLLAMLAKSKHILRHAEARLLKHNECKSVLTTVRSMNPVSMKYRGIFKLAARKEAGNEERSGAKYIINYAGVPVDLAPQEIFDIWFKKHFRDDRSRTVKTSYSQ